MEAKSEEMHEMEREVKIKAKSKTDSHMSACSLSGLDEVKGRDLVGQANLSKATAMLVVMSSWRADGTRQE